ncbi:MAG: hypothetical protein WCJ64_03195 [Rhodospirillaceae bacterium]
MSAHKRKLLATVGKGSAGKTTLSRYLRHVHDVRGVPVVSCDADPINSTFSRYYRDAERVPRGRDVDIQNFLRDTVFEAVLSGTNVILDLGSGSEGVFGHWGLAQSIGQIAADEGFDLWILGVFCTNADAVTSVHHVMSQITPAKYAVVFNHGRLGDGDFQNVQNHEYFKEILQLSPMPLIIQEPALETSIYQFLDGRDLTFAEALATDCGLSRMAIAMLRAWLARMDAAFEQVIA